MVGSAAVTASVVGDVADLISVIIWPALIVGVLWVLREPVSAFAARVGSSAQRVTIGAQGLSVELSSAIEAVPRQSTTALAGVRAPDSAARVVDSAAVTMFAQLDQEEPAPYLVVDLGDGLEWLTTRLYIFSILLRATRRTRTLIFVETAGGVRGRFTGLASPERVRYALAHAYPWLEAHYADAYASATVNYRQPASANPPFIVDDQGRLLPLTAHAIAKRFVFAVQQNPPPPPVTDAPGWVIEERPTERFAEHASWLSGGDLEVLLGAALRRFALIVEATPRLPSELAMDALHLREEEVVAVVDEQRRFRDLVVSRREVLETFAQEAMESTPDGSD